VNTLPAERDLPPAARDAARARAVAAVTEWWPGRRVVPIAAAVAVVAVVAGAVVASDRWPAGTRTPASPTSASAPASVAPRTSVPSRPTGSPPPAPLVVPPPKAADRKRCFVPDGFRYVVGYRDSEATTWFFLRAAAKQSVTCIILAGRRGTFDWFPNEWFTDGLAPAPNGHLTLTSDSTNALPSGWGILVGAVPAATRKVVVEGPDGLRRAGLGSSWYVFHFHDRGGNRSVYAYDADDDVIASGHL
jgi:hypothetical protein